MISIRNLRYKLSISLLLGLLQLVVPSQTVGAQESVRYYDPTTCIEIRCEADSDMFPAEWKASPIFAKADNLNKMQVDRSIRLMRMELTKYPPAMLQQNLKRVYVVQHLAYYRTQVAGFGSDDTLYIDNDYVENASYTDAFIKGTFHHEFAHVLVSNHAEKFSYANWRKLTPPPFHYGKGGLANIRSGRYQTKPDSFYWKKGFANEYAMSDVDEDMASLAECMFLGDRHFWQAVDQSPILKKKVRMLTGFYHSLDSAFTESYFRAIKPGNTPLPLDQSYRPGDVVLFPDGGQIVMNGTPRITITIQPWQSAIFPVGARPVFNPPIPDKIEKTDKDESNNANQNPQKTTAPLSPISPRPNAPRGYAAVYLNGSWIIIPGGSTVNRKENTIHVGPRSPVYHPGDQVTFENGGVIIRPGEFNRIEVVKGAKAVFPDTAVVIFNAPDEMKVQSDTTPVLPPK